MWRFFNKVFGWDYVLITNSANSKIARIWWTQNSEPMVSPYSFQTWVLRPPYNGWEVTPLTSRAALIIEAAKLKQ